MLQCHQPEPWGESNRYHHFFYREDFIEKSTKLHLFTYYLQPTTKKKQKQTLYKKE